MLGMGGWRGTHSPGDLRPYFFQEAPRPPTSCRSLAQAQGALISVPSPGPRQRLGPPSGKFVSWAPWASATISKWTHL